MLKKVIKEMEAVFQDIPYGVEHTMRVLDNAEQIMSGENVSAETRQIVFLAAILHDIGAVEAQKKHGSMEGRFQELEGPSIAKRILDQFGVSSEISKRVCYIIAHHHTPLKIDGIDFQILWEADYLDFLLFAEHEKNEVFLYQKVEENFKTVAGKAFAYKQFGIERTPS